MLEEDGVCQARGQLPLLLLLLFQCFMLRSESDCGVRLHETLIGCQLRFEFRILGETLHLFRVLSFMFHQYLFP